jgi:hypothetical protein
VAEDVHGGLAAVDRDTAAWTKVCIAKGVAIFRQRHFSVCPTIEIVEYRPGNSSLGHPAKIGNINDGRRV